MTPLTDWEAKDPQKSSGFWHCLVCQDNRWREGKHCNLHEMTRNHMTAISYHKNFQGNDSLASDRFYLTSETRDNKNEKPEGTFLMELEVKDQLNDPEYENNMPENTPSTIIDMEGISLYTSSEEQAVMCIAHTIDNWLANRHQIDIDTYSDEDKYEQLTTYEAQHEQPSGRLNVFYFMHNISNTYIDFTAILKTSLSRLSHIGCDENWFPWLDKTV